MRAHLAACDECREQLESIEKAQEKLQDYPEAEADVYVPEHILAAIPKPANQPASGAGSRHAVSEPSMSRTVIPGAGRR